ncbi:MAG: DUF547 domain-containing protein [Bacteroidetes bacterium]|nr:MAG: DUF547 domain-containing protein [Bacteroidota bacterium]
MGSFASKIANQTMTQKLNSLSKQFLLAIKKQEPTKELRRQLSAFTLAELQLQLTTDEQRQAFWLNIYNAYFLYLRRNQLIGKPELYRQALVPFADFSLSLDEVEHGILRRARAKWSLGYLPSWNPSRAVRKLMVDKLDPRIHFALNCGAQSCPPIACYQPARIDQQLDQATLSFLEQGTRLDEATRTVHFTRLGLWYLGDFGGKAGIRRLLGRYLKLAAGNWRIRFQDYNWDENLANFA